MVAEGATVSGPIDQLALNDVLQHVLSLSNYTSEQARRDDEAALQAALSVELPAPPTEPTPPDPKDAEIAELQAQLAEATKAEADEDAAEAGSTPAPAPDVPGDPGSVS